VTWARAGDRPREAPPYPTGTPSRSAAGGHDAYVVRAPRTPQEHLPAHPQKQQPENHEAHASIEGKATSSSSRVDADHAKLATNSAPETQSDRGAHSQPSSSSRGAENSGFGQKQPTEGRGSQSTSSSSRSRSKETRPASFESPSNSGTARAQPQKSVQPQKKSSTRKPTPSRTKKSKPSRGRS
jgi:hypothetical protein